MRDIAFLVYPGYSLMALAIVAGFEVANSMQGGPFYDLHFVSEAGGPVNTLAWMGAAGSRSSPRCLSCLRNPTASRRR